MTSAPPLEPGSPSEPDVLRGAGTGILVVRGGAIRAAGYGVGMLLTGVGSVFLLRHLGVVDFGRYVTVMSLVAIVSAVSDAGLTAIGNRELAVRPPGAERRALLANLTGIRIVTTLGGIVAATAFALVAGYDSAMVEGTLLASSGLLLVNVQAALALPLSVELRAGALAALELLKQVVLVVGIGLLVAAGATLLPFFLVHVAMGIAVLAALPFFLARSELVWPRLESGRWRPLAREALPLATALTLNIAYFRTLVIMASLLETGRVTGLVGTSYRVMEMLLGIPNLVLLVALPVLSAAGREDERRLAYVNQRMTEVALLASVYLALMVAIVAEPALVLFGGEEYRDAAPVLQIQVFALVGVFLGQVWQFALIAINRQRAMISANLVALVVVIGLGLVLLPAMGAEGAAVAALVAETVLAGALLVLLARARPSARPRFGFAWKVVVAGGLAASVLLVPGLPALVRVALATAAYAAAVVALRAVPPEVRDAARRRSASS